MRDYKSVKFRDFLSFGVLGELSRFSLIDTGADALSDVRWRRKSGAHGKRTTDPSPRRS